MDSTARDFLMDRNLAIVYLIRYKGLRPKEIASINRGMVNLAQSSLEFKQNHYKLLGKPIDHIRAYVQTIEPLKQPGHTRTIRYLFPTIIVVRIFNTIMKKKNRNGYRHEAYRK